MTTTEGTLLPITAADVPIRTWWGSVVRWPPVQRKGSCRDCEYRLMCGQLEREGQPLPCEGLLDVEVAQ
jgi:hypothetical protein